MEYSAVIHPPVTPCSFIQRGTVSSIVTPQVTRVLPHSIRVDPLAWGAMWFWKRTGRKASARRPSRRRSGNAGEDWLSSMRLFPVPFQGGERVLQAVEFRIRPWIQNLSKIVDSVRNGFYRARQGGAAGVGVSATLKLLGYSQGLAIAAPYAVNDVAGCPAEQGNEHWIRCVM